MLLILSSSSSHTVLSPLLILSSASFYMYTVLILFSHLRSLFSYCPQPSSHSFLIHFPYCSQPLLIPSSASSYMYTDLILFSHRPQLSCHSLLSLFPYLILFILDFVLLISTFYIHLILTRIFILFLSYAHPYSHCTPLSKFSQ